MSQRFYLPREQVFTNLGAIGAGWKLYTYETGTTTPKATYSNAALSVANANPIIADSSGRFGDIFVGDLSTYKAILKDSSDNTIWTSDPVDPKTFTLTDFDPAPVSFWGTTTGTSTAYELAADPAQTAYTSNSVFYLKFHIACGASPTIDIDDLGILNLKKRNGTGAKTALEANDVLPNYKYDAENDGTDIVILNPEKPILNLKNATAATESVAGIAKVATQTIANTGTNDTDFLTALKAALLRRPTFSAFLSSSPALSANTETRINFNTKSWDTNSWYDNATNFRFTPQRAGYYFIKSTITSIPGTDQSILIENRIRKNGTVIDRSTVTGRAGATPTAGASCSTIINMNGSTDYIDVAAFSNGSGTIQSGASNTSFSAIYLGGL